MRPTSLVLALAVHASASAAQMDTKSTQASPDPAAYGPVVKEAYDRVRAATAPFKDLSAAVAAGYAATVQNCLADAMHGAMGYHHINRAYVDQTLDVEHPEILLYERLADSSYALNGVEFIVPYRVWPADSVPPRIMGRELQRSDDLKLWYMHMWVWKPNAAGLFANWNPAAACRTPPAER